MEETKRWTRFLSVDARARTRRGERVKHILARAVAGLCAYKLFGDKDKEGDEQGNGEGRR